MVIGMATFNVNVDDEVAKKFRIKVIQRHGTLRGFIDKCMEEAMKDWTEHKNGV